LKAGVMLAGLKPVAWRATAETTRIHVAVTGVTISEAPGFFLP
jgi:hypothetical protein